MAALRPIVFVAPYSPIGSCDKPSIGASTKIVALLRILSSFNRPILLLNSAHNRLVNAKGRVRRLNVSGKRAVVQLEPFTLRVRPVGKLSNLFCARQLAERLANLDPVLVWAYNGYAF